MLARFVLIGGMIACLATHAARAESPTIELTQTATLRISNVAVDAPPTVEVVSDDALPIVWNRGTLRAADLSLVLAPGVVDPIVVTLLNQSRSIVVAGAAVPQVTIEAARYAKLTTWRPTSSPRDRRTTLLLAVAMATTLLLASLLRRGGAIALATVAVAWTAGLALTTHAPTLIQRDDADGSRWFLAVEPQTLRVPIRSGEAWVPAVESMEHLRSLSPRIIVDGKDATMQITLPRGGKVGLRINNVSD